MDLKFALRSLRKNGGFTLLAVLVLALGIGANTAIFTVINSVLLRPLGYRDPERIVRIGNTWRDRAVSMGNLSAPDFFDLHSQATVFEALSMYVGGGGGDSVIVGNTAEYASVVRVAPEFFEALGAQAAIGRLFSQDEQRPGGPQVAVISDRFRQRRFGGNPAVIGATLQVYGKVFTVVGATAAGFSYPTGIDVWLPLSETTVSRSAHNYSGIGRLKSGVTLQGAQAELSAIAARLEQAYPASNKNKDFEAMRLQDLMVRGVRTTLYLLLGAVALVLLISCANVANLLLARAASRRREVAVRSALGASRWQIVRQLLLESALLSLLAGAAGVALASWGVDALLALAPTVLPSFAQIRIDGTVLGFTLALSVAVSFLCGLAPALQSGKADLADALKQGGSRGSVPTASGRLRGALVVFEIAISIVLLIGAGLLLRSFAALAGSDWGFNPDRLLVMQANVSSSSLEQAKRVTRTYAEILRQVQVVPGVIDASGAYGLPGAYSSNGGYSLEGGPGFEQLGMARMPQADFVVATPNYFKTMNIPLKMGRDFNDRDQFEADFVTVVNEALVRQSFPNENPIGRRIGCGLDSPNYMTIVGIVGDTRQADPSLPPRPAIYMPYLQHPLYGRALSFVIRTPGDPLALSEPLRRTVRQVSTEIPVKFTTVEARISSTVSSPRFRGVLLAIFAALAVGLAMAGVYGVMAYMVTQRGAEIGLRMALGAGRPNIVGMVLRRGLQLAALGLAFGLAGAAAATRLIATMLYAVKPTDAATFAAMAALVIVVTALACAVPAWRASRVDPMSALRQE
ncbi:MAG TPA: ABC transporter permease [Bryobacteraceae bacterium]|jgi:predicted permease